ncbi:MAG: DNA-directed RNA polymerase subunit beta [Eubacteriales bacterium]|nr:DNA-directed RNA polymerase subunit beta [Eubacteriales bacterium]
MQTGERTREVLMGKRTRHTFARVNEAIEMPDLIEVQKKSYQRFIDEEMIDVLRDVSPICDYSDTLELSFVGFTLEKDKPKYSVQECKNRDATYAAPLKVVVRLVNKSTGEVKEQEVFMGDFPLMTDTGTFIINGAERVIVSQLMRSPGAYFDMVPDKLGKKLFNAQIIPIRGAWLEFECDSNDVMWIRVDRTRKLPVTVFLRALGIGTDAQIKSVFGENVYTLATIEKDTSHTEEEGLFELYRRLRPGEPPTVEGVKALINALFFDPKRYDLMRVGRYKLNKKLSLAKRIINHTIAADVISPVTGEVVVEAGTKIDTVELAESVQDSGANIVYVFSEKDGTTPVKIIGNGFVNTRGWLPFNGCEENGFNEKIRFSVIKEILDKYPDDVEAQTAEINARHDELMPKTILIDDIISAVNYNMSLMHGIGWTDDIDHLGNRRVRSVGELLQNQIRIGLARMERIIKERMAIQDIETISPQSLINTRPVTSAIKEFFGSSQLSQFMDQNNPLAELANKRRLSALGPGGLNRDRASFEVRDVHHSHYGRMCPIETPEGPNIGLINSLATFARINEYGFIESPYRRIDKATGRVTDEIVYMTADEEDFYIIAQANEPLDGEGRLLNKRVTVRRRDEILPMDASKVDFIDVSPKQIVSIATAMIPFLENDDASRALMGSNMQRQAVPLLKPEAPLVATGIEYKAACDSGVCWLAAKDGVVEKVAGDSITLRYDDGEVETFELQKFRRSNQGTCINQRPIVQYGERVKANQVIADGPSTDGGEMSLGRNILIGFMTWEGYNYEDAMLVSEKLVKDDIFTSVHIEEYELEARDTKLGLEEITRDIPNVGADMLKNLDERGIVRIGAEVRSGDILVGKVTPKGETELTAEERLLRAIFGEKAREVRDTSLRVPHGEYGIIVDVKIFTRENKDELSPGVHELVRVYIAQKRKVGVGDKMAGRHGNKGVISRVLPEADMPFLPDGTPLQIVLNPLGVPSRMNIGQVLEVHLGLAAKALGWHVATPVFDGAEEEDIEELLDRANMPRNGKMRLRDGRTGEFFENPVTVGYMYILKLCHLVDDKIHARSIGPYSLVTQQPLGGKAQFGGQRFGEMEVWALEAYGAAHTLQEILTVKSDDVIGRVKTYEAIVKGESIPEPGIPESFKVLIKELQSLALDVKVLTADKQEIRLKELIEDDPDPTMEYVNEREEDNPINAVDITPDFDEDEEEEDFDTEFDEDEDFWGFDDEEAESEELPEDDE